MCGDAVRGADGCDGAGFDDGDADGVWRGDAAGGGGGRGADGELQCGGAEHCGGAAGGVCGGGRDRGVDSAGERDAEWRGGSGDGGGVDGLRAGWLLLRRRAWRTRLGVAQMAAMVGPLAAGAQATGQACAWTTVCAGFAAVGVDPSAWRLAVVSGAGQAVAASGTFAPVVLMVTDGRGDPVAGAAVAIHQTVDAAEMACPARGPCPVAPVLGASRRAAVSDANGLVSVTPMQMAGVGEVTNVAVAAGTQGFVSLSLAQGP